MKRPVSLLIAIGLLSLLVILSSLLPMVSGQRFAGVSQENTISNSPQGILQTGTKPDDQSPAERSPNGTLPFNGIPGDQNRVLEYVLYSLILALGLIALTGLLRWKLWGNIVSIIAAILVLVPTIPMVLKPESTLLLIECGIKVILAVGVIILLLLPVSKPGSVKLIGN